MDKGGWRRIDFIQRKPQSLCSMTRGCCMLWCPCSPCPPHKHADDTLYQDWLRPPCSWTGSRSFIKLLGSPSSSPRPCLLVSVQTRQSLSVPKEIQKQQSTLRLRLQWLKTPSLNAFTAQASTTRVPVCCFRNQ